MLIQLLFARIPRLHRTPTETRGWPVNNAMCTLDTELHCMKLSFRVGLLSVQVTNVLVACCMELRAFWPRYHAIRNCSLRSKLRITWSDTRRRRHVWRQVSNRAISPQANTVISRSSVPRVRFDATSSWRCHPSVVKLVHVVASASLFAVANFGSTMDSFASGTVRSICSVDNSCPVRDATNP